MSIVMQLMVDTHLVHVGTWKNFESARVAPCHLAVLYPQLHSTLLEFPGLAKKFSTVNAGATSIKRPVQICVF